MSERLDDSGRPLSERRDGEARREEDRGWFQRIPDWLKGGSVALALITASVAFGMGISTTRAEQAGIPPRIALLELQAVRTDSLLRVRRGESLDNKRMLLYVVCRVDGGSETQCNRYYRMTDQQIVDAVPGIVEGKDP